MNTRIAPPLATRLQKLLLMLSSTHPGEVTNAVSLIDTTLRDAGCDWHDLAYALTHPPAHHTYIERPDTGWRSMRKFCLDHQQFLRPRELSFVTDLDRWRGALTKKQLAWLTVLYERCNRANAEAS